MLAATGKDWRREIPRLSLWSPYAGREGSRKDAGGPLLPKKLKQPWLRREASQIAPSSVPGSSDAKSPALLFLPENVRKDLETGGDKMNCG